MPHSSRFYTSRDIASKIEPLPETDLVGRPISASETPIKKGIQLVRFYLVAVAGLPATLAGPFQRTFSNRRRAGLLEGILRQVFIGRER